MKNNLKILSVMAVALAVVFSTAGSALAFSAPHELAYCHSIENGLASFCDPVNSLREVNDFAPVIAVTGLQVASGSAPAAAATSLREVNDFVQSAVATSLREVNDMALVMPAAFYFGAR